MASHEQAMEILGGLIKRIDENEMKEKKKMEMEAKFRMEMEGKLEKEKKNVTSYQSYLKLSLKKQSQDKELLKKCSRAIHDRIFLKDNIFNGILDVHDDGTIMTVAYPYHYYPFSDPKVIEKELNDIGLFIHMTHPYCMITGRLIMMKDITCIDSIHYFVVDHNLSVESSDFNTLLNKDIKRKNEEVERITKIVKNYDDMIKRKIKKY
jgi:hypothetical protein